MPYVMKRNIIILLVVLLAGCFIRDGRVQIVRPLFGSASKIVPRVSYIEWNHMDYQHFLSEVETKKCFLIYMRTNNCLECDRLEDTIFSDFDIVEKIHSRFYPVEITSDDPDFEKFVDLFELVDVPAVAFAVHSTMKLWDTNNEESLHILIDQLYKECKIDNSY